MGPMCFQEELTELVAGDKSQRSIELSRSMFA